MTVMIKLVIVIKCVLFSLFCNAQQQEVYMFSYFKNNGKDGLHLAYSNDGYKWTALKVINHFFNRF